MRGVIDMAMDMQTRDGGLLYRMPVLGPVMVRRHLDAVCDAYIARADGLNDWYLHKLFLQAASCARVDVQELHAAVTERKESAVREMDCAGPDTLSALVRRLIMHHAAALWSAENENESLAAMLAAGRMVLAANAAETKELAYYATLGRKCVALLHTECARDMARRLTGMESVSAVVLGYIEKFIERSHADFAQSFTRYVIKTVTA